MKSLACAVFTFIFSGIPCSAFAATIHVDLNGGGDYLTIQECIDAASEGDTCLVALGTYVENINFFGKAITLTSQAGPKFTTIDGNQSGSVVTFANGEESDSILEGFKITNGSGTNASYGTLGGGIYCGEDLYLNASSPLITNNIIVANTALYGGGIGCEWFSNPTIIENLIIGNSYEGIRCEFATPEIINNFIVANDGDGIHGWESSSQIMDNIVIYNFENGIGIEDAQVDLRNNIISNNRGDGIFSYNFDKSTTVNNIVSSNSGYGIRCENHASITITNNTVVDNLSGGIVSSYGSHFSIINSILWNNNVPYEIELIDDGSPGSIISYSNVRGGLNSVYECLDCSLGWDEGMIDEDPSFVSPADNNYHLKWNSPCIDAGTDAGVYTDIDGDVRPQGLGFEIGADEFIFHCWDKDEDGYDDFTCGGTDCDDDDTLINPIMPEIPDNGTDDDCDGLIDEPGCFVNAVL